MIILLASCSNNKPSEEDVSIVEEQLKSNFDLKSDFQNFKTKMTEMDTLRIFVDHSVCTYQGYERLMITKHSDSIIVSSEFKDYDNQTPEWEKVFDKTISENDTIWNFGEFMNRNKNRLINDGEKYAKIEVTNGEQKLRFATDGLIDLNNFKTDYDTTMRKLYKPKGILIYGYPVFDDMNIDESD